MNQTFRNATDATTTGSSRTAATALRFDAAAPDRGADSATPTRSARCLDLANLVRHVDTVDSTLTALAAQVRAHADAPSYTTIIARHQSAGRGRSGRTWVDDPDQSLLLATLIRIDDEHLTWATLIVGIAVARALEERGLSPQLKWPNDVVIDGRKVAGILCEHIDEVDGTHLVGVGIGLNLGTVPEDAGPMAGTTGLQTAYSNPALVRDRLAAQILANLSSLIDEGDRDLWRALYTERLLGFRVATTVHLPGGADASVCPTGIDADGALLARTRSGSDLVITVGDVDLPHPADRPEGPSA